MKEIDRDALREQLHAGDPYRGEEMPAPDVARIKARMRATAGGARVRSNWIPAAAAAMIAVAVALGTWVNSHPSSTEEPLALPEPASADGSLVSESRPEPLPDAPPDAPQDTDASMVDDAAQTEFVAVQPAPASPQTVERRPAAIAPVEPMGEVGAAVAEMTVAADDTPRGESRRIQFTARGGTRVIWTLDPDFEPRTTSKDAPPARRQQGANDKW